VGVVADFIEWPSFPAWVINPETATAGYNAETRTYVQTWRGPDLVADAGIDGLQVYLEQTNSARDGIVLTSPATIALDLRGEDYRQLTVAEARELIGMLTEAIDDVECETTCGL
jgi:hypothetical protein